MKGRTAECPNCGRNMAQNAYIASDELIPFVCHCGRPFGDVPWIDLGQPTGPAPDYRFPPQPIGPAPLRAVGLLTTAADIIGGDRGKTHGDIKTGFRRIADLWSAFLDHPVTPEDVAWCLALMKAARSATGAKTEDHYIDAAGYAAIAGELRE